MSALSVRGLRISIRGRVVVDGVDLHVAAGECVAVVGESGAGKSLTVRALLGLAPRGARVESETLVVGGVDVRGLGERGWRRLRGARVALVSQDALVSLDPLRSVGAEVVESAVIHGARMSGSRRRQRAAELLARVAVPEPERRVHQFPHELSGGLRQRALIAAALSAGPALLVADEPTTALDATVQLRILRLLRSIVDDGVALVFVSHDVAAVRRVADRVVVLRDGRVVETGTTAEVLDAPRHPYTAELVAASRVLPREQRAHRGGPILRVREVSKRFDRPAVVRASFDLTRGRTLGIVGESGSGKTTLARIVVGVESPDSGRLEWADDARPRVQLVHQNPLGAFDPRWTIRRSLREALAAGGVARADRRGRVEALLAEVGLAPDLATRRPAALSGGQLQRAAIARALAAAPDVLVLDEPVSALDATVRARILTLLDALQRRRDLTMILVSHDLDVVAAVADDILVMQDGRIVESGPVADVFAAPQHPFTRELVEAGTAP